MENVNKTWDTKILGRTKENEKLYKESKHFLYL